MSEPKDIKYLGRVMQIMNQAWTPHKGQADAGQAIFNSDADLLFVECGRKFGKSEFAVYCCWMYALTKPGAEVYYLAPAVKQAKELVWANGRAQTCNTYGETFIKQIEKLLGAPVKIYHHEMRIVLPNGSFIKIDGSDNYNTQRGLKPDFVVADEYRDFKSEWIEAVRPNMSVKPGKILFITTPPHGPNHAYEMAEECKFGMANEDKHYFYLNLPSNCNDRIAGHTEWLKREEERLLRLGRRNEWRREYMAEFITSDEHAVIPQLNRDILEPVEAIYSRLSSRSDDLELYVAIDPGNSSVFAAVAGIFDPHTTELFILDLIYEKDAQISSIRHIWPRLKEKIEHITKSIGKSGMPCHVYHNNRTPWLARDLYEIFKIPSISVPKALKDPIHNISLLKDILSAGKLYVADTCKDLITESELYQRSKNTFKIPQDEKQLINCLRYMVWACNYTTEALGFPPEIPKDEDFLARLEQLVPFNEKMSDLAASEYGILDEHDDAENWEDY